MSRDALFGKLSLLKIRHTGVRETGVGPQGIDPWACNFVGADLVSARLSTHCSPTGGHKVRPYEHPFSLIEAPD